MVTVMVQSDNNGDGIGVVKVVEDIVFMHCSDDENSNDMGTMVIVTASARHSNDSKSGALEKMET